MFGVFRKSMMYFLRVLSRKLTR